MYIPFMHKTVTFACNKDQVMENYTKYHLSWSWSIHGNCDGTLNF